jgi:two-component system, NarL family, response regulator NreC
MAVSQQTNKPVSSIIRVLIADDHGLMRAGLAALLKCETDMEVVGAAANGREALRLARELRPDVLLADISMPPPDGIELARLLKAELPECRTLIVSMHDDLQLVQNALNAGAAGYLVKHALEADLSRAVRTVAGGQVYMYEGLRPRPAAAPGPAPAPRPGHPAAALTSFEVRLLRSLAAGATRAELAADLHIAADEAETRQNELLARLGLRSRPDVIKFVAEYAPSSR